MVPVLLTKIERRNCKWKRKYTAQINLVDVDVEKGNDNERNVQTCY